MEIEDIILEDETNVEDILLQEEVEVEEVETEFLKGKDGYTPIKGVDYYTEAEKQEFIDNIKNGIQPVLTEVAQNEAERNAAETIRKSNETKRVTDERLRNSDEIARKQAERTRESNENKRISNEDTRIANETIRNENEELRKSAENIRVTKEAERQNHETIREENEEARKTQESSRQSAEDIRKTLEDERKAAENVRASNENTRVSNENARIENETAREEVITKLQKENAQFKEELEYVNNVILENIFDKVVSEDRTMSNAVPLNADISYEGRSTQETSDNMPSPEYPSEIKSVGDSINKAYDGWAEDFVKRINGIRAKIVTFDNKKCLYYTADAGYGDYDNKYMFKIKFKERTRYTFNFDLYAINNTFANLSIAYTDGTTTNFPNVVHQAQWENVRITSSENKTIKYLRANWSSKDDYIDLDTFMVYEGTDDKEYSPFQLNISEVIQNKNLFTGLTKGIGLSGTTGSQTTNATGATSDYIKVDFVNNNNYYLSGLINNLFSFVASYDENKNFIGRTGALSGTFFSLNKNLFASGSGSKEYDKIKYIRITQYENVNVTGKIDDIDNAKIQLEIGTSATDYTPHQQTNITLPLQQPFRSIGETRDIFEKKDGKWYEVHNIGKVVLDGSENDWILHNSTASGNDYKLSGIINGYGDSDNTIYPILCSHFKSNKQGNIYKGEQGISMLGKIYNSIYISLGNKYSLAEFKTWLSAHPVTVQYELKDPLYLECTEEQVQALEEKIRLYDGMNYINSLNEVEAKVKVEYYKKKTEVV